MTREEAKRRLLNIERSLPNTFRTKEDVRNFEALEMAIQALEQEPSGDLISRQATLEPYKTLKDTDTLCVGLIRANILQQKSINPQEPKTGHWIVHDWEDMREKGYYRCSVCGTGYQRFVKGIRKSDVPYIDGQEYTLQNIDNYCPNCGARMQESEVNNE